MEYKTKFSSNDNLSKNKISKSLSVNSGSQYGDHVDQVKYLFLVQKLNFICFSMMGRNFTLTKTQNTFTRTHLQGDTTFCWLYSVTSSIHQSLKLKAGKVEFYKEIDYRNYCILLCF